METLKRHLPFSAQEGLQELKKIAIRLEEKIYTTATNQFDYLRKISLEMLLMEIRSPNAMPATPMDPEDQSQARQQLVSQNMQSIPGVSQNSVGNSMGQGIPSTMFANSQRQMPASLDSTAQTGHANGADWQDQIYQKIKVMKETYFPEINEMYRRIAAKLQQHDSHPQQPKSEQLEKLEVFKAMLERLITFLQVSKNNIKPSFKEKLGSNEKHIVSFLNPSRFRKPIPNLQLGQLPQPHVQPMQQSQSLVPQLQSHENQLNTQLQSMNVQGFVPTMQQNNMSSLQHGSLSSLSGVSMSQPIMMMWDERF
ncbi:hypothetical protein BDE02_03G021600 [Populus trichocarpa]|nr:hypothetical protein BDE02_03G021600 [Populus trichocarpa]